MEMPSEELLLFYLGFNVLYKKCHSSCVYTAFHD